MNKDLSLWQFIHKRLKAKKPVMLLIVADSSGSSPGRQGFKMAISRSGNMHGSIGGGIMEVKLVELAKSRLQKQERSSLVKKQIHSTTATHHRSGMICSGEQTVIYCYLPPWFAKPVKRIIRSLKNHEPALLRLSIAGETMQMDVLPGTQNEIAFRFQKKNDTAFLYEENLGIRDRLYIIGGGHCAFALSALMSTMDFHITLLDDRPELSTLRKNKYVHEKHVLASYEEIDPWIREGDHTYIAIMTLGYRSDEIVLRHLLDKQVRYLGLLGSANKIKIMMAKLAKEKIPRSVLQRVHAPIGVQIHSHTPEEIAVSIAAEIIGVKNGAVSS